MYRSLYDGKEDVLIVLGRIGGIFRSKKIASSTFVCT